MTKPKGKPKKKIPPTALQMEIREMAKNWPEGDTNLVAIKCTGIECAIPLGSQHEDAKKALKFCAQARKFGATEKGFLFLVKAQAALKDFELFDAAIKGEKFNRPGRGHGPIRKKIAALLKKNPEIKNPKLLAVIIDKPPRGWAWYDSRVGKYFEGPTSADHMVQQRFFTVCGEERKKLKK